jgi:hypothetical protein
MIRKLLVVAMIVPYMALCVYDLTNGRPRTGIVAGLLAAVNFVMYWE